MRSVSFATTALFLLLLACTKPLVAQMPPPWVWQSIGGSDMQFFHRPDISDSTYEIRFRTFYPCRSCSGAGYVFSSGGVFCTVQDTSSAGPASMQSWSGWIPQNLLALNPYTGDSAAHKVFASCAPGAPNFITGSFTGNATVWAGYQDTFEVIREFCYSRLVTLPYKSGMWQALPIQAQSFQCNSPNIIGSYTGIDMQFGTNLDTINYYYWNGWSASAIPYNCRAIAQINTLVPNSSPYFMSYPVAHFPKGVPVSYKQNAIDPDGDSLVWSSLYMVMWDTAHGAQPASFWAPFPPQMQ